MTTRHRSSRVGAAVAAIADEGAIDRAAAGDVDLFWMVGGNFLETVGDTALSLLKFSLNEMASAIQK